MCSYRAHSSVKNLLKFTRKSLWNLLENYFEIYLKITWKLLGNLLENYFGIYSKITCKFTRKLLGNLLENYLGIYWKITWEFTRKLLENLLENYLQIYSKLIVRRLCHVTFTKGHFLQYVSTVHAVLHMPINGHACVIFRMDECIVEVMFVSYGHTTLDIPDPIRTPKSSRVGLT